MEGYKTLKAGQAVEFNIVEGPKGLHAVDITEGAATGTDGFTDSEDNETGEGLGVSVELNVDETNPRDDRDQSSLSTG